MRLVSTLQAADIQTQVRIRFAEFNRTNSSSKRRKYPLYYRRWYAKLRHKRGPLDAKQADGCIIYGFVTLVQDRQGSVGSAEGCKATSTGAGRQPER